MSIQERRLKKGWSQEELALHSGLSTRTIQRIERGQKASLESLKCLASVLETSIRTLMQENTMNHTIKPGQPTDQDFEREAVDYVQKVKAVRIHLIIFALVMPALYVLNLYISPEYLWVGLVAISWGSALVFIFALFALTGLFGASWERKQFQKRMRKYRS